MLRRIRKRISKTGASLALLSLELIIVFVLFFISLILFILIAKNVFLSNKHEIDTKGFAFVARLVNDVNTDIMQFFTFLGTHYFLIPANLLLIAYFLFIKKHKWYSIKIPVISATTTGMLFFMKQLFNRPRPLIPLLKEARGLSFPSGHAMISFTFYGLLIYIVWQSVEKAWVKWTLTILLSLVIFMIGFSRIYLRVHYTTDVLAGFCVGLVWLVIAILVLQRIEKYSKRNINPVVAQEGEPTQLKASA